MGRGVSVDSGAVKGGIKCCQTSIQELDSTIKKLISSYRRAGEGGWRDKKYADLGRILQECCMAMSKPSEELRICLLKLEELLKTIEEYEQTKI